MADNISEILGLTAPADAEPSADPNSFTGGMSGAAPALDDNTMVLHDDEPDKVVTLPSLDLPKFSKQLKSDPGVLDIFKSGLSNRLQDYTKGTGIDVAYLTFDATGNTELAKQQRNLRLAFQVKMAEDSQLPDAPSFMQEVTSSLGGMAGDMYMMAGASALGAVAVAAAGITAAPVVATGAATAGIMAMAYKGITSLTSELRDKGVDKLPAYTYGFATGTVQGLLERYGYLSMTKAFAVKLAPATERFISKLPGLVRGGAVAATKGAIGATGEAATEVSQGVLEDTVRYSTGAEAPDLKNFMHSRALEVATAMFGGTATGATSVLVNRRAMIKRMQDEGVPKDLAISAVDEHLMEVAKLQMQAAQETIGVTDSHMAKMGSAFDDKLDKKLSIEREVEEFGAQVKVNAQEFSQLRVDEEGNVIAPTEGESAVTVEKTPEQKEAAKFKTPEEYINSKKLTDPAAVKTATEFWREATKTTKTIKASAVREESLKRLRGVASSYDKSRSYTVQEIKDVRRALDNLITATSLTPENQNLLRKRAASIVTDRDFHSKFPAYRELVNKLVTAERVNLYREYAQHLLGKLQTKKVSPDTRVFAEHLEGILTGKIKEPKYSDDVRGIIESTLFDLKEQDFTEYNGMVVVDALKDLYKNGVEIYQSARQEREAAFVELRDKAIEKLKGIKGGRDLSKAHDLQIEEAKRVQGDRARGGTILPLNWWLTDWLVRDRMDRSGTAKVGEGLFVKELSMQESDLGYQTAMGNFTHGYDSGFKQIYGQERDTLMHEHRTVEVGAIQYVQDTSADKVTLRPELPLTKSTAMYLYMTAQDPYGRNILINKNHIDQAWLERFERGEEVKFSEQDWAFMKYIREQIDSLAPSIKAAYETLTNRPFAQQQNYFMIERFFSNEEKVAPTLASELLGEADGPLQIESKHNLLSRSGGNSMVKIKDVYSSFYSYMRDMNHFIYYAKALEKRRKLLSDPLVRDGIRAKMGEGYLQLLDNATDMYTTMGSQRGVQNAAFGAVERVLGRLVKSVLATPGAALRQVSGILMGLEYVSPRELVDSFYSMPADYKSGVAKDFFEAGALRYRWSSGMYDQALAISNAMIRKGDKAAFYDKKGFNDALEFFVKSGDQFSSMRVGYAVYKKTLAKTGDKARAVSDAMDAIGSTQQSLAIEHTPLVFYDKNFFARWSVLFAKTPAQYMARFYIPRLAAAKDALMKDPSRINAAKVAQTIAFYHVVVPLMDYLVTFKDIPRDGEDALWVVSAPVRYMTLVTDAVGGLVGLLAEAAGVDIDDKMKGDEGAFLSRFADMAKYATKALIEAIENPDWFTSTPEETLENAGNVAKEVVPAVAATMGLPGDKAVNMANGFYYLSNFFSSGDGFDLQMGLRGTLLQQSEQGAQKAVARSEE